MITVALYQNQNKERYLGLKAHYHYRGRLNDIPGANFDKKRKVWWVPMSSYDYVKENFRGELFYKTPEWRIEGKTPPKRQSKKLISGREIKLPELKIKLYDFQAEGIVQMVDSLLTFNFVLNADPVGFGKTIQSIGCIDWLRKNENLKRVLIICKKSIKTQWKEEILDKSYNTAPIFVTGEKPKDRQFAYMGAKNNKECVLITSYHNFLNDKEFIDKINFNLVIIDEAHTIKGRNGKINNAIKSVIPKTRTIFLSGTPVMARPDDIYGIVSMADDSYFGEYRNFEKMFLVRELGIYGDQIVGAKNLDILKAKIDKFIVRRTFMDVSLELPKVREKTIKIEMDSVQKKLAQIIADQEQYIDDQKAKYIGPGGIPFEETRAEFDKILEKGKAFLAAKQFIADDPRIFLQSNDTYISKMLTKHIPNDYKISSKTEVCLDLVSEIVDSDEKVIIFTRLQRSAQLILEELNKKNIKAVIYTGRENDEERERAKYEFKNNDDVHVLIGNEACAEGLNLQFAKYMIMYEQTDTFAQKTQRIGRIRRIGSKHDSIQVYNLITKNSYDESREKKMERDHNISSALVS